MNGIFVPNSVGVLLGVGTHQLIATEINTGCKDSIEIVVLCNSGTVTNPDTVDMVIEVGTDTLYCFDESELSGDVVTVINDCEEETLGIATYEVEHECVTITGEEIGDDIACFVFCDANGVCDTVVVFTEVVPNGGIIPPVAVDDDTMTVIDVPVTSYAILLNDTLGSETVTIEIISDPSFGTVTINSDNTIDYTPNPGVCDEQDVFTYLITTPNGSAIANVYVDILCEPISVFNGFSPNGDGINDTFTILGIERYPNNEVMLFNRWGNQVYFKRHYTNEEGWDGSWESNLLPDGTYFYVIYDGEGAKYSGYVQINR